MAVVVVDIAKLEHAMTASFLQPFISGIVIFQQVLRLVVHTVNTVFH